MTAESNRAAMPEELKSALQKLAADDWAGAHEIVQKFSDAPSCRIHALLHRIEGDDFNARYWYGQARVEFPPCDTTAELQQLLNEYGGD